MMGRPSSSHLQVRNSPRGHIYVLSGWPLPSDENKIPSVNTYLDIIHRIALEEWKLKRESTFVEDVACELYDHAKRVKRISPANFRLMLRLRMTQMRKSARWEDRRTYMGSKIHEVIEQYCLQKLGLPTKSVKMPEDDAERGWVERALRSFIEWEREVGFVPIAVEESVVHLDWLCAGRYDIKGWVNGKVVIIDIKTGAMIYDRHRVQVVFYRLADNAMGNEPLAEGQMILKLGRNDREPPFEAEVVSDIPPSLAEKGLTVEKVMLAARTCYEFEYGIQPPIRGEEVYG